MKKSVKKKQKRVVKRSPFKARGISKIALVAIVAVFLAGVGGIYAYSLKPLELTSSGLPIIKQSLNPDCKHKDPELCKFLNNFQTQTSYSVISTGSYGGITVESMYEISGEDKFHMVSKQNGKENSNMISIGDTTYTLDYTDNTWWKQTLKPEDPEKMAANEVKEQFAFDETEVEDKTTYKFIAKEACGDLQCFKYEMISPDMAETQMFMWFDDRDYLMRRMRTEDKTSGVSESVYSYNNISINVPSPVKEGTPNNFGGGATDMNDPEVQKMLKQYQEQYPDGASSADSNGTAESYAPEEY